ncbi:helix-hairpin-helix domain-containing protein [Ornithinibacillus salinisoli]|uniref:Helix-hairpin-helix domain-containing protein n=1 Tax=Ornithinibacillus salinisoli TaxID=1848459 RepID=A0ABW4W2X5_9BACI
MKKYSFFILIGFVIIIVLISTSKFSKDEQEAYIPITADTPNEPIESLEEIQNESEIVVDIKGEVFNPGVYKMTINSRVEDVVKMAGGFSENADQTVVNLAQKVHDEMIIVVPEVGEEQTTITKDNEGKIRVNYASIEEIQTLNGIGPSKAQAIIQYREENGFFGSVEDLLNVSGIGEKTLENIQDEIIIP